MENTLGYAAHQFGLGFFKGQTGLISITAFQRHFHLLDKGTDPTFAGFIYFSTPGIGANSFLCL